MKAEEYQNPLGMMLTIKYWRGGDDDEYLK